MAAAYLKHPDSLLWQEEIRGIHTHTHTHTHIHTHACTHTHIEAHTHTNTYTHTNIEAHTYPRSHSGPLLGLAMVGAEKRSLLLLLGSSALTDPGGFTDFTVESAGLERPGL